MQYILVNVFVDESFTRLAKMLFTGCLPNVSPKVIGREWKVDEWPTDERVMPLVLCEKKESLRKHGVKVPREFVLERRDLLPAYDIQSAKYSSPFGRLRSRLSCIEKWMQGCEEQTVSKEEFALWFEGMFRAYCFQDEDVHGASGQLRLPQITEQQAILIKCSYDKLRQMLLDENGSFKSSGTINDSSFENLRKHVTDNSAESWSEDDDKRLTRRFGVANLDYNDADAENLNFLRACFKDEFDLIGKAVESYFCERSEESWVDMCCVVALMLKRLAVSRYSGEPIRYLSPTRKLNVLLLDDDAIAEGRRLGGDVRLNSIFSFDALQLVARAHDDFFAWVVGELKRRVTQQRRTYDFILLDLSLGELIGQDLSGYHLIKRLQQMFPHMPVVVYSKFDDMGHIVRALNNGARWFLKKTDVIKLPRHALSMLRMRNWHKEWMTVCKNRLCEFSFEQPGEGRTRDFVTQFSDGRKYLTYKCLEGLPGSRIVIHPMRGGYSAAVTFRAMKGSQGGQSPVIVKIDTEFNTRMEYERYNRFIRPYIANESGRVEHPAVIIDRNQSAIVYTFAGKKDDAHELVTLKSRLLTDAKANSSCDYEKYAFAFEVLLNDILPQIHRMRPELEFGEQGTACNGNGDGAIPLPWMTSFPNAAFGEKAKLQELNNPMGSGLFGYVIDADSYLANYLCRMPFCQEMSDPEFVMQPKLDCETGLDGCLPYEFHDVEESDASCAVEVYDDRKLTIRLTGPAVDHIVRYRPRLYPAMTLWMRGNKDVTLAASKLSLDSGMIAAIKKVAQDREDKAVGALCYYTVFLLSGKRNGAFLKKTYELAHCIDYLEKCYWQNYERAQDLLKDTKRFYCPVGIVHGDMNFANIMIELRKDFGKRIAFSDDKPDISDVWLIDFARTRRDLVAHDFNVLFTSTVELLFDQGAWNDEYESLMGRVFKRYMDAAICGESDAIPDCVPSAEKRLAMVFRILRVIRAAALKTGMTEDAYVLTTALACMVSSRIFLIHSGNVYSSAAMIAIAELCLEKLKK